MPVEVHLPAKWLYRCASYVVASFKYSFNLSLRNSLSGPFVTVYQCIDLKRLKTDRRVMHIHHVYLIGRRAPA